MSQNLGALGTLKKLLNGFLFPQIWNEWVLTPPNFNGLREENKITH